METAGITVADSRSRLGSTMLRLLKRQRNTDPPTSGANNCRRAMQKSETSFLSGPNAAFITELYARYAEDPQSVDGDWRDYFSSLGEEAQAALGDLRGASWAPREANFVNGARFNGEGAAALHAPAGNGVAEPAAAQEAPSLEALRNAA